MSRFTQLSIAILAATAMGAVVAQSTPPNPNAANPAVGAGQQSSQATPMGTTGTQAGSGATASGATSGSTMSGSTGSSSTGSSTMTDSSTGSGSTMGSTDTTTASASSMRAARADRN